MRNIEGVLWLSLIALPIIIAGMMTFASHFSPSLGWIVYRVGAETIRREIYLYRMKATEYSDEKEPDIAKKQRKLLENIEKVNAKQTTSIRLCPSCKPMNRIIGNLRERIKARFTDTPSDNGFSPLEGEQYLEWRIIPQRNWYIERINKDYRNLRWSRTYMIVIAGLGSLLAAIGGGFEHYVVVTTAAGLAASTYVQLRMYGQTYIGYHITAKKLDTEVARWMTLSPEQQKEGEWVAKMVQAMEDIFQDERMMWMQVATQAQTSGEQALIKISANGQTRASVCWVKISQTNNRPTPSHCCNLLAAAHRSRQHRTMTSQLDRKPGDTGHIVSPFYVISYC